MAQFNLADYETVEERLKRLATVHEDYRIITENVTTREDRERGLWVIKSVLYLNAEDQRLHLPKSTGYAFEIDGGAGASKFSALENCETSSIGRCLANANFSGNKRSTREEMAKVNRAQTPAKPVEKWDKPVISWDEEIAGADTKHALKGLYALAKAEGVSQDILDAITAKGKAATD